MESGMCDVRGLTAAAPGGERLQGLSAGARWGAHPAILHLDIDAFFASVEQLRDPRLRGRPVIVGSGVVASASYEARAYGIHAGTPLAEARRLCPTAALLAGHAPTYRAFAERVFALAAELSPAIETYLDDALVELSGTERLHGHLIRASARLQRRIREETGLSVSLGLGSNRMIARMVTRLAKPGGFAWLRPGGELTFVGRRPVEELPGIGPHRAAVLRQMGIARVAELRELSSAHLRDLFGDLGLVIAARARGHETQAVHPGELPRSIRRETSFGEPETEARSLAGMLHYLLERAAAQARRLGAEPRALRVHLRWADGEGSARREALNGEGAVTEALFARASAILERLWGRRMGVRNVGVELSQLHLCRRPQLELFAVAQGEEAGWRECGAAPAAMPADPFLADLHGMAGLGVRVAGGAPVPDGALAGRVGREHWRRQARLDAVVDRVREQFGFRALVRGPSIELLERLPSDTYGFVLRTPCLTR